MEDILRFLYFLSLLRVSDHSSETPIFSCPDKISIRESFDIDLNIEETV